VAGVAHCPVHPPPRDFEGRVALTISGLLMAGGQTLPDHCYVGGRHRAKHQVHRVWQQTQMVQRVWQQTQMVQRVWQQTQV
jgi:hypothetical protein